VSEANGVVCARVFQERASPERSARRSGSRHELKRSRAVRAGDQAERNDEGVQRCGAGRAASHWPAGSPPRLFWASPRFRAAGGHAALPSATQEREPRPMSERSVSESGDERRADPPRSFLAAVEARRQPMGAAGSPPG